MEPVAAVYGWSEPVMEDLDLERLVAWSEMAQARLKERVELAMAGGCAWRS